MGLVLKNFNRQRPIEKLREKTWVDKLLEKYPNCPNPIHYPASAEYYLRTRL